jgi:hypothetical protein
MIHGHLKEHDCKTSSRAISESVLHCTVGNVVVVVVVVVMVMVMVVGILVIGVVYY